MVTFVESDYEHFIKPEQEFQVPKRAVFNPEDMKIWLKSEGYSEYVGFIRALNNVVRGQPNDGDYSKSGVVNGQLFVLDTLDRWIDEIPPIDQPQRFGNQAFKRFYNRLTENGTELLMQSVPDVFHAALNEIKYYFFEGFGNSTRIDYGTGHEMSFCMYMFSLFKVGALKTTDQKAAICYIFKRYLEICRKLQTVYNMEPAGSRGVWALDDFQFLPFLWGSSQLLDSQAVHIDPSKFYTQEIVDQYADKFLFIGCIKYISTVKKGPFAEHSNQLWNISGVPTWDKINSGLIRMYIDEVLAKFPVIQHVMFGTLFSLSLAPREPFKNPQLLPFQANSRAPPPRPLSQPKLPPSEDPASSSEQK